MPAYLVKIADSAKRDIQRIYDWLLLEAPLNAPDWFEALLRRLYSLEQQPLRCPIARESLLFNRPIRCLLFGKRRGTYRILYEVDHDRHIVWILHVRHGSLDELSPEEIANPDF